MILLITVFAFSICISRIAIGSWNLPFSGNLAMCLMLCFTALGHIMFTKGMAMMIPPIIPFKTELVYITGFAEVIFGMALLFPSLRPSVGCILIMFFILLLPANIYAAIKHLDLEKATYTGPGLSYLWFRIPEQVFFILWVYFFSIKL